MMQLTDLQFIGHDLVRPECVLTTAAGDIYTSDFRGGITQIAADGSQHFFGGGGVPGVGVLKPNGFALLKDGSFLIAHLGDTLGGIFQLTREDKITPFLTEVGGEPLPPSNFVFLDHQDRLWITVSTRHIPRAAAYRSDVKDGFIVLVDAQGARIVADGLGYTNEVWVNPEGTVLYVNATFSRELWRYDIGADGALTHKILITHFSEGVYPDGLTMDTEGFLWVASIVSNRLLRIDPRNGTTTIMLSDTDAEHLAWVEAAYQRNEMGRPHLDQVKSTQLRNISSLAFGGPQRSTITLGCLLGQSLAQISSPYQGIAPAHWLFDEGGKRP